MLYIAIGIMGFGIAFVFDWASMRDIRVVKQLAGLMAFSLLIFAAIMVCVSPTKLDVPLFVRIIGGCLLAVSLCLLIFSLFIELPFRGTYAKQGAGEKLVSTGTYALVRHPGVIWLAFVFLALSLLYPSTTLFLAVAVWWLVDVIYVTVQDKYFFPKMFPGYPDYKKETPFLIPTRHSFLACLKTLRFPTAPNNR
jgi:protein-S-isoprenylcysteine O-methyltransferase Ste14